MIFTGGERAARSVRWRPGPGHAGGGAERPGLPSPRASGGTRALAPFWPPCVLARPEPGCYWPGALASSGSGRGARAGRCRHGAAKSQNTEGQDVDGTASLECRADCLPDEPVPCSRRAEGGPRRFRCGVDLAWPPAVHGLDHQRGRAPGSRYLELTRLATPTVAGQGDHPDYGPAADPYALIAVAARPVARRDRTANHKYL